MMNSKKRKIKSMLRENKQLKLYKKALKSSNCFYLITKIASIFDTTISDNELYQLEINLIENINDQKIWAKVFYDSSIFFKFPFNQCDWKSFGLFMYYNWGVATFKKNPAKNTSFYNYENFNDLNAIKSNYYNNWINSILNTKDLEFNIYIRKVLNLL